MPPLGQRPAGRALGLGEGGREVGGARHHLAGRAHLRAEHRVGAREADERQHGGLDAHLRAACGRAAARSSVGQARAGGDPAGGVDEVGADRLARERNRARRARVDLEHEDLAVGDRELDVEQADDAERRGEPADDVVDLGERRRGETPGAGSTHDESPEWTPASSTCCITAAT